MEKIIEENRHQFIYGYNGKERKTILEKLEKLYPVIIDDNKPMAIYLNEIGLPKFDQINEELDIIKLISTSREYLNCIIIKSILKKIEIDVDRKTIDNRIKPLISKINKLYLNESFPQITKLEELIEALNETQFKYLEFYQQYIRGKINTMNINTLKIPFLDFISLIRHIKSLLNNQSYFCIIADHQQEISTLSQKTINTLVNMRINADISMKVACNPNEWNTYYDVSDMHIDEIHDYAKIEIDDCYKEYTKKIIQRRKL